jgi:hypothetical protein
MGEDRTVMRSVDRDDAGDCIVPLRTQIRACSEAAHAVADQRDTICTTACAQLLNGEL